MFCQTCPKKEFCTVLCPEAEAFAAQDHETRREHFSFPQVNYTSLPEPEEDPPKLSKTDNLTDFYNLKIVIPWVEAKARISLEAVYARCDRYGISENDPGPCSMGVDQGKYLHVTIGKLHPDRAGKIVYSGSIRMG